MVWVVQTLVLTLGEALEELVEVGVGKRDVRGAERRHDLDAGRLDDAPAKHADCGPRRPSGTRPIMAVVADDTAFVEHRVNAERPQAVTCQLHIEPNPATAGPPPPGRPNMASRHGERALTSREARRQSGGHRGAPLRCDGRS